MGQVQTQKHFPCVCVRARVGEQSLKATEAGSLTEANCRRQPLANLKLGPEHLVLLPVQVAPLTGGFWASHTQKAHLSSLPQMASSEAACLGDGPQSCRKPEPFLDTSSLPRFQSGLLHLPAGSGSFPGQTQGVGTRD